MRFIVLYKNNWKCKFKGTSEKHTISMYDPSEKLITVHTFYSCSLEESVKRYEAAGWKPSK